MVLAMRSGQGPNVITTRKSGSEPGWRPFSFFFFLRSPKFGQKKQLILSEDLFFWRSPKFGKKNRLNLIEDRSKCGSRSFDVAFSLQNSPPPFQIPGYAPEHSCPWPREGLSTVGLSLASDFFVFFALASSLMSLTSPLILNIKIIISKNQLKQRTIKIIIQKNNKQTTNLKEKTFKHSRESFLEPKSIFYSLSLH